MPYRLTQQALRELEAAGSYAFEHWPETAEDLIKAFGVMFERIGGWAPPGVVRKEFAPDIYRWVYLDPYPYWIVWAFGQTRQDRVIVRLLQANMEFVAQMEKTGRWS